MQNRREWQSDRWMMPERLEAGRCCTDVRILCDRSNTCWGFWRKRTSIEKLDYFISAATNSSFTKAARECGVAQSAISQQIASLEKELQCELFARSGRHVRLTGKGECFLEQAKKLQEQYELAVTQAKQISLEGNRHKLKIGVVGVRNSDSLIHVLSRLKARYPEVEVELEHCHQPEQLARLLRDRRYDLGFGHLPQRSLKGLMNHRLGLRPLQLMLPAEWFDERMKEPSLETLLKCVQRVYISRLLWCFLQGRYNFTVREREKIELIDDADVVIPMGLINRTAVLSLDVTTSMRYEQENFLRISIPQKELCMEEMIIYHPENNNPLVQQLLKCCS